MPRPLPITDALAIEIEDEYAELFGRLKADDEADESRVVRDLAQVIVSRYLDAHLEDDPGHLPPAVGEMAESLVDADDDDLAAELADRAENYIHAAVRQQRPA